ncbi:MULTISPECIES: class C sortase [unclassified Arthrobacter]|uniref:class C sortase n=1 Tax=Arthrobacter sp. Leaf234 TaxID=1736303 RepID=UPI000B130523|nr:class C sortase [Arthrobacter sp. Leaf234]
MKSKAGRQQGAPPSDVEGDNSEAIVDATEPMRAHRARERRRGWRLRLLPLLVALAVIAGAALLLYPTAAGWFSSVEQSHEIDKLTQGINDLGAETLRERLADARRYNQSLGGSGADVAANERLPLAQDPRSGNEEDYRSMLRGDSEGLMARIRIPSIAVDLPIYHGTGDDVLERGIGHLEGTALPVGGPSTHSVITGHRGLATSELFTNLDDVQVDDTFTIEVFGETLAYRVVETLVVDPRDTESLLIQPGEDLMTLVTCTPLGINSHRILVTGERISPTPQADIDAAGDAPDIPGFPWWMYIAGGVVVATTTYVWASGRPPRPVQLQVRGRRP